MASGYITSGRVIGFGMPTLRMTLPVGPLAPFVQGGVGLGGISSPGEAGMAFLAGGGLMVHVGRIVAFGVDVSYQGITGTEFQTVAIGPAIAIGG
jgi:hypothetical protein